MSSASSARSSSSSSSSPARWSLLTGVIALSLTTACQREADPILDLYIMPLYIAGMIPMGVNVGARDVLKASRGWRTFSFVVAVLYAIGGVVAVAAGWPRSGVFALLLAAACGYLPFRKRASAAVKPIV